MRRTSQIVKAYRYSTQNIRKFGYTIPSKFSYLLGNRAVNLPIKNPKYRSKQDFISEHDNPQVFVEIKTENLEWLYSFSDKIFCAETDERYPFYNPALDISTPGISAFRVSRSVVDNNLTSKYKTDYIDDNTVQVQVSKISGYDSLFQLDYFETEDSRMLLKAIILCDMSNSSTSFVDIVYGCRRAPEDFEAARKICSAFRSVLIYMRPWNYSTEHKICEITPIFNYESVKSWK